MMHDHYELEKTVLRSDEAFTLYRAEKASVEIEKNTFAVPIKLEEEKVGYVFVGQGKLVVDTIVETEEGAFGKPIERTLSEPFLMLGNTEQTSQHFRPASHDDLKKSAVDERTLLDSAQRLLDRFSSKSAVHGPADLCNRSGWIFAFSNGENRLDHLVSKGSELVYNAKDMSFVSKGNKSILHSSGRVVLSRHGKPIVVNTPHLPHPPHSCC
jgi:hypothetical protein